MNAQMSFFQLRKAFGSRLLFDIQQIDLLPGLCILLSGRNGAGKTTLLKTLAGLEPADRGMVRWREKLLRQRRAFSILRSHVVYVHQQPYMFDTSVEENVAYGLRVARVSARARARSVAQALEWAGLGDLASRNARTLSGGEKQSLAFARAWVLKPEVLLLDEPVASMDRQARTQTALLLRRMKNDSMCIVVTSHDQQDFAALGDLHWRLEDGSLHSVQPAGPVQENGTLPLTARSPAAARPPAPEVGTTRWIMNGTEP